MLPVVVAGGRTFSKIYFAIVQCTCISRNVVVFWFSTFFCTLSINMIGLMWFVMLLLLSPAVYASPEPGTFPNVPFNVFNDFISKNFNNNISLSAVLLIFFTLIENTDLLNLHARQKIKVLPGEKSTQATGWINCLSRALYDRMSRQNTEEMLFTSSELLQFTEEEKPITPLSVKLDELAIALGLIPKAKKVPKTKLLPISQKEIQPVLVICPRSVVCEDMDCIPRSLVQKTKLRDIPKVTLIKSTTIYKNVPLLTGHCPKCDTLYSADREKVLQNKANKKYTAVYLNSALYLKVGQSLWVDRVFSTAVLNGMYSFHGSASAYGEFWNNSFGTTNKENEYLITRRQVWQSFVQESIRTIASSIDPSNNLELDAELKIKEVAEQAFNLLGQNGHIHSAAGHACAECTHKYKHTADVMPPDNDPQNATTISEEMNVDFAPVTMVVIDGIVMGPTVSILQNKMSLLN